MGLFGVFLGALIGYKYIILLFRGFSLEEEGVGLGTGWVRYRVGGGGEIFFKGSSEIYFISIDFY